MRRHILDIAWFVVFCLFAVGQAGGGQQLGTARPAGVVGDGRADDTAAIQRAVDSGTGEIRFPKGVYRLTRTITVDLDRVGPTSIHGDGTASVVMAGPGPAFRFVGTHEGTADPKSVKPNVWQRQRTPMVDGLEIVGAHPQACGIEATGTMQLTVTRLVVRKALHGIHLVKRNRNVIIANCHIYENRGVGIFYDEVNLHQSNILGCHVSYNAAGGIVIRGGNVRNVHIGTCDIEGNMGGADSPATANVVLDSTGGSIGEVAITGCTIQHSHGAPDSANIRVNGESTARPFTDETRHGNITIADNVLSDVQVNVDVSNARGLTITGNTIWMGYTHDLRIDHCASVVVGDNVFDRNPRYGYGDAADARGGLVFGDCDGGSVSGNHVLGGGDAEAAIALRRCRRFNITDCTILDYGRCGLLLEDVSDSRVSDCLIRDDRPDQEASMSLSLGGGRGNMIVDNRLGNRFRIEPESAHQAGNMVDGD